MSENFLSHHQELFSTLSEAEQEIIIAGQNHNIPVQANFFLQNTNIETEADTKFNLGSDYTSQTTKYSLSQFTLGSSMTFTLPKITSGANDWSNLLSTMLRRAFS
ncbi:hypothetical protein [Anabaena sp. UHCC 0451]|uniref:hypothetical protein n=1 Tax=Anabaena sp. UHCC 0451 TaxID=2055235 RepID=UPI002B21924E|nr:hypothetical protein [Anabaena sp. UHCC 0451]MEA5579361.1 hypothetical protein [Anabaena sp. UHCC 0451]